MDSLLSKLFEGDDSSFYARMAAHGDVLISDDDFADCYSAGMGRPSIPPSLLMKTVLLQMRDDVSDREAARRAAKDLDWKRALGLDADDVPFHHTTLSVFRSRLLVNDADERVLLATLERAVQAGLFPKRVVGIVDSTGVMGAAAVADTFMLLRQAVAKLGAAAGDRLTKRLRRTINRLCVNKARIDWADPAARRPHLGELVELARTVLAATAGDEDLIEARDLLVRIIDQDIDEDPEDGGGPAIRHGVASDRVCSVVDPEMRHGRKTSSQRIDGYKSHVLSDHDTELVLGVSVTPANDADGPEAAGLVAAAKGAGVPVREVLGDTAYGDGDTRRAVEDAGAKVTAKTQPPSPTGKFTKNDFVIDPDTPAATCPAGHTTTTTGVGRDHKGRRVTVLKFADHLCRTCPLRSRCTSSAHGRWITLNFHEARLQAARVEQTRPSTRRKLRRRALIERKLAEGKRHGMGKARYRGTRKVLLQQRLVAGLLNIKRLFVIAPTLGDPIDA
ncbi:MAG TPA: IS1182 family transposase [Acidimicrobiales bacterium]|nr:IS1182 family transposase [Acidimicrobiales bacterium]